FVYIARCIHGFFWSLSSTSANTNACDIIPKSRFGEGLGYFGLTYSVAMALAPAFGLFILDIAGFKTMFLSATVLALIALIMLTRVKLHPLPAKKTTISANIPLSARLAGLFNKDAMPAAIIAFLISIPYAGLVSFVALYAAAEGVGNGGIYFTLQAISAAALRVFSGKLSDTKGEALPIYLGSAAHFIALLLLAVGHNPWLFYLSGLLVGMSTGLSMPAMQTMSVRIVPLDQRGSASSTYLCSFDIASIIGGVLAGALVTLRNYRIMFGIQMIPIALAALLYYFWASKTKSAFKVAQINQKQEKN
ncbi:MAG: MFS transporter, partial [Clostridiales bacterium]